MIDRHSDAWRVVAAWAGEELSDASERIEEIGVGPAETENLRGRIAALRELLAMADEPKPPIVVQAEGYRFQGADDV